MIREVHKWTFAIVLYRWNWVITAVYGAIMIQDARLNYHYFNIYFNIYFNWMTKWRLYGIHYWVLLKTNEKRVWILNESRTI